MVVGGIAVHELLSALKKNPAQAYLITGDALKRQALAYEAAAILLCVGEERPCGKCRGCVLYGAGANTDFVLLESERGASIKIDEVRALESKIQEATARLMRVVLINDAHKMVTQAQNALLKTLEEPPKNTVILLCGDEAGLLATIRSRCVIIRLGTSQIKPSAAMDIAQTLCAQLYNGEFKAENYVLHKDDLPEILECQSILLRDAIASKVGARLTYNALDDRSKEYTVEQLNACIAVLLDGKKRLGANANVALTADYIAIMLRHALGDRK